MPQAHPLVKSNQCMLVEAVNMCKNGRGRGSGSFLDAAMRGRLRIRQRVVAPLTPVAAGGAGGMPVPGMKQSKAQ